MSEVELLERHTAEADRAKRNDHFVNAASIALAALFSWFVLSMLLDNTSPVSVDDPVQVMNPGPVPRNGSLIIKYKVTVDRVCNGDGQRVFTDAGGIQQPATPFSNTSGLRSDGQVIELGKTFEDTIKVSVPNSAAPGPATYQNHSEYYCNFWQKLLHKGIPFDFPLIKFTIGKDTLPEVQPSTTIFKKHSANPMSWLRRRVWLLQGDDR